jgi:hypothetical protein
MVCVLVPLLLKRNVGVLFWDLRGPRSDAPFFNFLWFCNYFMGIIYIYIYIHSQFISVTPNLFETYLMRSYLYGCYVYKLNHTGRC